MSPNFFCPYLPPGNYSMPANIPPQPCPYNIPAQLPVQMPMELPAAGYEVPMMQAPVMQAPVMPPSMAQTSFMPDMDDMDMGMGPQAFTSDPPPIVSDNPAAATIVFLKELTGYPNYGNPSRNADILYTGNRATWTLDLPPYLTVPGNLFARLTIRGSLDDHYNVNVNRYSARISINGITVHNGQVPFEHGSPAGGMFTNWRVVTFNVTNIRRNNRIIIVNTSTAGVNDFIAFDWMELRLIPRR